MRFWQFSQRFQTKPYRFYVIMAVMAPHRQVMSHHYIGRVFRRIFLGSPASARFWSVPAAEFPGRFYVVNMSSGLSTIAGWAELARIGGLRRNCKAKRCKAEACEKARARVYAWSLLQSFELPRPVATAARTNI